jgi:hypothetical protein
MESEAASTKTSFASLPVELQTQVLTFALPLPQRLSEGIPLGNRYLYCYDIADKHDEFRSSVQALVTACPEFSRLIIHVLQKLK